MNPGFSIRRVGCFQDTWIRGFLLTNQAICPSHYFHNKNGSFDENYFHVPNANNTVKSLDGGRLHGLSRLGPTSGLSLSLIIRHSINTKITESWNNPLVGPSPSAQRFDIWQAPACTILLIRFKWMKYSIRSKLHITSFKISR